MLRKGAGEPHCGLKGSSGLGFLAPCPWCLVYERGLSPRLNTDDRRGQRGWRVEELRPSTRCTFQWSLSLDPLSGQVWGIGGAPGAERSLRTPRVPPHRSPALFSFPSDDLAYPAHHTGLSPVEACESKPLRKKRERFLLNVGLDYACVYVCVCLHKPACVFVGVYLMEFYFCEILL